MSCRCQFCSVVLMFFAACVFLQAQTTGAIAGTVVDSSGAVVANADVRVRNSGTGAERRGTSDTSGRFLAEALPVGVYEVHVTAPGFKTASRTGLQLNVADRLGVAIRLEVGEITESVSVTAEAPLVKTETGDVSYLVATKQITELPVSNRNYLSLQQLIPGASRTVGDEQQVGGWGGNKGFAINGQRDKYSGLMLDGVQNTDMGNQTTQMTTPGLETISEVKILSSNYSAEYGVAGGANILVVTRAGTQQLHGAVYEYVRNDKLNARNFFAATRPMMRLNNFGYRLGGPVIIPGKYNQNRGKTFFFFSEEWRVLRLATIVRASTPTAAMRNGDFSEEAARIARPARDPLSGQPFPDNRIPASRLNNNSKLLLGHDFPMPNAPGFQNFLYNFSVPQNWRQELVRVDHNFTDSTRATFRVIHESWNQRQAGSFDTIWTEWDLPAGNYAGKLNKILNPSMLTEFSFNYAYNYGPRSKPTIAPAGNYLQPQGLNIKKIFPLPEGRPNKVPDLSFSAGWSGIGSGYYPWWAHHDIKTVNNITTKNFASHALKFGVEYQFSTTPVQSQTSPSVQGSFSFSGIFTNHPHGDFLLGQASSYGELDVYREPRYDYHQAEMFIQDDWKASRKLAINLGLRYFNIPHAYEKDDSLTVFRADRWNPAKAPAVLADGTILRGSGDLLNGIAGVKNGLRRGLVENHPWKFAPRLGFAYDLRGDAQTVLRGGYGIGYYRIEGNDVYRLVDNPPFANVVTVFNPPLDDPTRGTLGADLPKSIFSLDPVYDIPMVQSYSLGVQRKLAADTSLTLSYVGTRGTHLDRGRQLNQPTPAGGLDFDPRLNTRQVSADSLRPYPGWASVSVRENTASSTYHSLQVDFNRAFRNGLHVQGVYTFSKTLADADGFGANPQNPYNMKAERGLAGFDRTHMLIFNYIYELPFWRHPSNLMQRILGGWQLDGITAYQTGTPFSPGLSGATGGLAGRPDVVAGQDVRGSRTQRAWFNTAAFVAPAYGRYGNAGRNILRGPAIHKWDVGLIKNFRFRENMNVQFRWEVMNALNHTNFSGVSAGLGSGNFGQVTSARDPRSMQFGLKMEF
ncbi:MAG: TonB-dependent receptor [Acidobacteriota bacterium]